MVQDAKSGPTPFGSSDLPAAAPVALGAGHPLRLELILKSAPGEPGEDPFVILSDDPARARVYLGRIMAGEQTVLRYVAVKVQPRRGEPSGLEGQSLNQAARDRRWLAEWRHYAALAPVVGAADAVTPDFGSSGASGSPGFSGVTPVLFVEPGEARAGKAAQPGAWPPLVYCTVQRRLFAARARDGAVLRVCRDNKVLAQYGLPPYGGGQTFLWDPESEAARGEGNAEPNFYQVPGQPGMGDEVDNDTLHPRAEAFDECLRGMADLALEPTRTVDPKTADGLKRLAELAAGFPCMLTAECLQDLSGAHAPSHIEPWLLDETWALVLELNALHYDEYCDLLGGIEEKAFNERYMGPAAAAGQRLRLQQPAVKRQFGRRLLFDQDASGIDALEMFRLKWSLFGQLVSGVQEYHRRTGAPHLRLSPRHAMVQVAALGPGLPAHWQFETRLVSLGSPTLDLSEFSNQFEEAPELYVPPVGSDPLYEAELVRNSSFGIIQRGDFLLTAVEELGGGHFKIKGQVHHDGIGLRWLSTKDHLMVNLGRHLVADAAVDFLATRDEVKEYSQRVIHLQSRPIKLDAAKRAAVEKLRGIRVPNATFRLLPALHVPCDLYSLGMLLFRSLVVNDAQGIGEVALGLEDLRQDLASLADIECDEGQDAYFWDALLRGHREPAVAELFERRNIFFHEHQRVKERPNAVPKNLWSEALAIGLRLVTQFENFSFCANHGDYDPAYPAQKVETLARRVEELQRKIDTALFALTARNAEVRQALEKVTQESLVG